jgi:hypothetical protein
MEQMQPSTKNIKRYRKLKIFLIFVTALVVGFFVYKYSYIYRERQKFKSVETDITKVANELRSIGFETSSFSSCERAQVKFANGPLTCRVGIVYEGNNINLSVKEPLEKFIAAIQRFDFKPVGSDELNPTSNPITIGTASFSSSSSISSCGLTYSKDDASYSYELLFSCGKSSRFAIYKEI